MFCPNCGAQLEDGAAFCNQCGTRLGAQQEQPQQAQQPYQQPYQQAQQTYQQPYQQPYQQAQPYYGTGDNGKSAMIMGIVALVLSEFGIFGIIFGAIAKKKAKAADPGAVMTKLGRVFGTIGLVVGIIMTVFLAIYFIALIAAFS